MESAPPPASGPAIDGIIKPFVCLAGCDDQLNAVTAACYPNRNDPAAAATTPDGEACAKATAALRSCMQVTGVFYDFNVRDIIKAPDPLIEGTINALLCLDGYEDKLDAAVATCYPGAGDKTAATPKPDVVACAKAGAALRNCMQVQFKAGVHMGGTAMEQHQGNSN